jgi:RNA recognition motif-containing protein
MEQAQENKLYVGNLPYTINDSKLEEMFNSLEGIKVTEAQVIMERTTGRSKGFGFVTLENAEMAKKAAELMNGHEVEDRKLVVNPSRPKVDRDRDGRGGGRGDRNFRPHR